MPSPLDETKHCGVDAGSLRQAGLLGAGERGAGPAGHLRGPGGGGRGPGADGSSGGFSVLRERIAQVRYERSGLFEENKFGAPGNIKAGAVLLVLVLVLVQKKKGETKRKTFLRVPKFCKQCKGGRTHERGAVVQCK